MTSLVVQWLRLCAFNARDSGLIPGRVTKTPHAVRSGQKEKKMYIKHMVSKIECPKSKSDYKNLIIKLGVNIRNIESIPCLFKYVVIIATSVLFYKRNPKTCHIVFEFF